MPDTLDRVGLQLQSREEILTRLNMNFRAIYGNDINIGSNTPDGQLLNIVSQLAADFREILERVYNSQNIDTAEGVALDLKAALTRTARRPGSYSVANVEITTDRRVDLIGLNEPDREPYTVQDNEGNRWQLVNSVSPDGVVTARFRAAEQGPIVARPNEITTAETIVIGVISINNPASQLTIGESEESDFNLRARAKMAVSRTASGFKESMELALRELPGMVSSIVLENSTSTTDANGIPGHSLWAILEGSSTNDDIANAIYAHKSAGCGLRGAITHDIPIVNSTQTFTAKWDIVKNQTAFVIMNVDHVTNNRNLIDFSKIVEDVVNNVDLRIGQTITQNRIISAISDQNILIEDTDFISGRTVNMGYKSDPGTSSRIAVCYNGHVSDHISTSDTDIEAINKIKAVPGLSGISVTGSLLSSPASGDSLMIEFPESVTPVTPIGVVEYKTITDVLAAPLNPSVEVLEFLPEEGTTSLGFTRGVSRSLVATDPSYRISFISGNVLSKNIFLEFDSSLGNNSVNGNDDFTITVRGGVAPFYTITDYGFGLGDYNVVSWNATQGGMPTNNLIDTRVTNIVTLNAGRVFTQGSVTVPQRRIVVTDLYGNQAQLDYMVIY